MLRAARPRQWPKNLLVFAAPLAGDSLGRDDGPAYALVAAAAFTAASVAVYLINDVLDGDIDESVYKAFEYKHMGSLAYIGNAAIFDFGGMNFGGGLLAVYLWRSVYFTQSVSLRTKTLMALDWFKRGLYGRGEFWIFLMRVICFADVMC